MPRDKAVEPQRAADQATAQTMEERYGGAVAADVP
jgi:hypothetical protein